MQLCRPKNKGTTTARHYNAASLSCERKHINVLNPHVQTRSNTYLTRFMKNFVPEFKWAIATTSGAKQLLIHTNNVL